MINIFYNKLKSNNGSAMMLAIVVLVISTMSIALFTSQVLNQIKFTKNTQDSMTSKYEVDAGIEIAVSELIKAVAADVNERTVVNGNEKYKIKTVNIDYTNSYQQNSPLYLENKNYDIKVETMPVDDINYYKIEPRDTNTFSCETKDNGNKTNTSSITLGKNDKSLDEFNIIYNIKVKSNKSNTKERIFKVDINLKNIIDQNTYGISYEFSEIKKGE